MDPGSIIKHFVYGGILIGIGVVGLIGVGQANQLYAGLLDQCEGTAATSNSICTQYLTGVPSFHSVKVWNDAYLGVFIALLVLGSLIVAAQIIQLVLV